MHSQPSGIFSPWVKFLCCSDIISTTHLPFVAGHEWGRQVWDWGWGLVSGGGAECSSVWVQQGKVNGHTGWGSTNRRKSDSVKLTSFTLSSVEQVVDGGSESFGLFFTGEIQTNLTGLKRERHRRLKTPSSLNKKYSTERLKSIKTAHFESQWAYLWTLTYDI